MLRNVTTGALRAGSDARSQRFATGARSGVDLHLCVPVEKSEPRQGHAQSPLTPKQAAFVSEYAQTGNATQSAIAAGYSKATAKQQGSRLLTHVDVIDAIRGVQATAAQRVMARTAEAAGSVAWIIEQAVNVVHEVENPRDRVPALTLLAKRHPEFRDAPVVDNSQHLNLSGLSQEQLDAAIERLSGR